MCFNPDYTKPVHVIVFSCKRSGTHHPLLMVNNVPAKRVPIHKHLGLIVDLILMNKLTPYCPKLIK